MPFPEVPPQTSHKHLLRSRHLEHPTVCILSALWANESFSTDEILLGSAPPDFVKVASPVTDSIASNFVRADPSNTSGELWRGLHVNELWFRGKQKEPKTENAPTHTY